MTTLRIASTGLIHSVGLFRWIEQAIMPFDDSKARELLDALGIRSDLIDPIIAGNYEAKADGETLVLTVKD